MGVRGVQERPLIPAEGMCPVRHRHLWNNERCYTIPGYRAGEQQIFQGGEGGRGSGIKGSCDGLTGPSSSLQVPERRSSWNLLMLRPGFVWRWDHPG